MGPIHMIFVFIGPLFRRQAALAAENLALRQQLDADGDGFGDACEDCDTDANKTRPGIYGCGTPDEGDADGDTVLDCVDLCEGLDDTIDADDNGVPDCAERIPTVSFWGLVVLALLFLTAGKVLFSRREAAKS